MVSNHTVKKSYVADTNLQTLDFLRNLFMLKMKSDFNPIYPRSLKMQSWHVINQIKSTHMDYLELKGFWNPSTCSREKWGVMCDMNFGTHCRLNPCLRTLVMVVLILTYVPTHCYILA